MNFKREKLQKEFLEREMTIKQSRDGREKKQNGVILNFSKTTKI